MTIYSNDYARCKGREHTPDECMTCARFDAAVQTYSKARTKEDMNRYTWLIAPVEIPCPMAENKVDEP